MAANNTSDEQRLPVATVWLRQATLADVPALETLLNRCYREASGWTHEADLIAGIRTTSHELKRLIADARQYLFVYPQTDTGTAEGTPTGQILACILVSFAKEGMPTAYIGMFAVSPEWQGKGVGNVVLAAAETFACRHLSTHNTDQPPVLTMSILNHRPELLAYYQRRGYQLTGGTDPFPEDGQNGTPKREDLRLMQLQKVCL